MQLWSYLSPLVLSRGLLDVFLNRSGAAPLVVSVNAVSGGKDLVLRQAYRRLLSTHLHRVQSLVYEDRETTWQLIPAEEIALLLQGPAPMLQVLSLPGSKRSKLLFKEANALLAFLSNRAQNIRRLDLRQFPPQCFPWTSPPAFITSLVLSFDASVDSAATHTLDGTLASLRAMPSLQRLSLSGFVSTPPQDLAPDHEPVHLPRLQILRITGNNDQHALLWKCLKMHPLCTVQLEIVRSHRYPATLRTAIVRHLAQSDTSALTEMVVSKNSATMISFSLFPPGQPPNELETSEFTHPSISIFVTWETPLEMAPHLPALQILLALPLQRMQQLTLDGLDRTRVDPEHMSELTPLLRTLEIFTLRSFRSPLLSSAFLSLGGVFSSNIATGFPFPRLRKVVLERCEFDVDVAGPALRDALTRRALVDAKLEEVSFVCCGISPARSEELYKELVQPGLIQRIVCKEDEN